MGMVAAFAYWEMRFGRHWPAPVALIVCLMILAPAFGALLELGIMRRLEGTSETTKLVVTLSLLLGLLGLALSVWDPNKPRPIRKFWDGQVVTVANVRLPYHQVAALAIAVLVAGGLPHPRHGASGSSVEFGASCESGESCDGVRAGRSGCRGGPRLNPPPFGVRTARRRVVAGVGVAAERKAMSNPPAEKPQSAPGRRSAAIRGC
jgi:hypothetical protein